MNGGTSSVLRTSMQPLSSFLRASLVPSTASTLTSVQSPTIVRFLTFLYWVLSLSYFSHFVVNSFHTSLSPFFFMNSCAFSYYLSFLLPDEPSGRDVVNSPAGCPTECCSLIYVDNSTVFFSANVAFVAP